jgi:hypothetical protein
MQFSIETWVDYERMKHLPGMRPGGFITIYPDPWAGCPEIQIEDDGMTSENVASAPAPNDETMLSPVSSALYSPFVTTSAEARAALKTGSIRRVADDTRLPPEEDLANLYSRISTYFTHGEAKAANPFGVGQLERRHVDVVGVEVIGKESHTLAQAAVEDTAGLLGSSELLRSQSYGNAMVARAAPQRSLSALCSESLPDLLAASCLSRVTLQGLLHGAHSPDEVTLEALRTAMQLLDADSRYPGIAGWRDLLTPANLAELLSISTEDARPRFRGRMTWTEEERARLIVHLIERAGNAALSGLLDISLLVGIPFCIVGPSEASMTSKIYTIQVLGANETTLTVRGQLRIVRDRPPERPVRVMKQSYQYALEPVPTTCETVR